MAACNVVIDLSHRNGNVDLTRVSAAGIIGEIPQGHAGTRIAGSSLCQTTPAGKSGWIVVGRVPLRNRCRRCGASRVFPECGQARTAP